MEPVSLADDLVLHERMIGEVGKSISKLKRRLHNAEITLNVRPPDSETAEIAAWNKRIESLISQRDVMSFPELRIVKRELNEQRNTAEDNHEKLIAKRENQRSKNKLLLQESLKKLDEFRANRHYGPSSSFGGKDDGEELKTIRNYSGGHFISKAFYIDNTNR